MEKLGKIFGSSYRVKIMRLFLFNDSKDFDIDDIVKRTFVSKVNAKKELTLLTKIDFLRKRQFTKKVINKTTKKVKTSGFLNKKVNGWTLNNKFELIDPLRSLLIESELIKEKEIIKRFKKTGNIKLMILSGLFIRDEDRKLDILIVGDRNDRNLLNKEIKKLESEIGKELTYAVFDTKEFEYRISMYDKLIRDVMENNHRLLINKIFEEYL